MGKSKTKNLGGRPRKFKTPEEMQVIIDKYFKKTEKPTVCGLAMALGFLDRGSLINYGEYSPGFFNTIKKAKFRVEEFLEKTLFGPKPTGAIFNLKNNFGWIEKTEQDLTLTGDIVFKENR